MRAVPVIDTSRFAAELRESGVEPRQADGMARALNNELAERVLTKAYLDERLLPIQHELASLGARLDVMEVKFDALDEKFETRLVAHDEKGETRSNALDEKFDTKFDALDEKFDTKFDALDEKFDTKFDALDEKFETKFNALDEKFDTKFSTLNEKFDTKFNALDTKITVLITMMLFGFTLLTALGLYNALPRATQTAAAPLMQESPQESPTAIVDAETKP